MLNPGFKVVAREGRFESGQAGQVFRCPHCKQPVLEAVTERFLTRCKKCRRWVYGERMGGCWKK